MKKPFLIDLDHGKKTIQKMGACSVASHIAIFDGRNGIDEQKINENWTLEGQPISKWYIEKHISVKNIKWYIRNYINIEDRIWNASFIIGLSRNGRIYWHRKCFPTFVWHGNEMIGNILKDSPFFGKITIKGNKCRSKWSKVPALCLNPSENSISFMAGVLSAARLSVKNNISYAMFSKKVSVLFEKWRIPIEKKDNNHIYISPFWVALLVPWMPSCCDIWKDIKSPCMAEEYAFIAWRIYTGAEIKTGAIPFLVSRRTFFYRYESVRDLEKDWIKYKLVELDERFKKVVQKWRDESV